MPRCAKSGTGKDAPLPRSRNSRRDFACVPPGVAPRPKCCGTSAATERGGRQGEDGRWRHKFDRNVYAMRPELDGIPYWSNIRIPALLVKGALSERISPQVVAAIRARCPHVELAEVPHSDHHVTLDNPGGFVSAATEFLGKHRKEAE